MVGTTLTEEEALLVKVGGPVVFGKVILDWDPHKAQRQILKSDAKTKVIAAGRRFGKSECMAIETMWFAITKANTKQFIISASQDQANIIFTTIFQFISRNPYLNSLVQKLNWTPFPEIYLVNGSVIHARSTSYDGKYLRGHSAHRIIVDEAAFLKNELINTVVKPMLADYDGHLVLISTPYGRNYFFDEFEEGMKKSSKTHESWQFPSYANPHISHEYIDKQKNYLLDLEFRSEYLAEFIDDQAVVFKWESINDATKDFTEKYEREEGHQYYIGVDIATTHDFTSITVIDATNPKKCFVRYTEYFNNKKYSFICERVLAIAQVFIPLKIMVDETGVGAGPTESIMQILPNAEGFVFSMPSKVALINTLKLGLEQRRLQISKNNARLLGELKYYEYDKTKNQTVRMHAAEGKFDDMVISTALAFMPCSVVCAEPCVIAIDKKKTHIVDTKDGLLATEPKPLIPEEPVVTVI